MRSSKPISLLAAAVLASCTHTAGGPPELPSSASPEWKRTKLEHSAPPPALANEGNPDCWKADYAGPGEAHVWACRYSAEGNAFEAVQRARAEANTVKFQEGPTFVLVQWDKASRDEITTLIRAVQRSFHPTAKKK